MKLYDYECDTCGKRFEAMGESAKCPQGACTGSGLRQLGGKPARVSSPTQGGYECKLTPHFDQSFSIGHVHAPDGRPIDVRAVPVEHHHVPKAKA